MPPAELAQRAAYSVQKSNHKGGIFSSKKQPLRRHFRFKKATIQAPFFVQKTSLKATFQLKRSNSKGDIFGSKK